MLQLETFQSHLKLVLPGEEFRCLLGVDPALKVEYKRAQLSSQQVGFMSRSCLSTNEQQISLRNAKANQSCRVTVREPIPKAVDEKIKICLLQPDLKAQRAEARLLAKESQLEWTVKLAPGEQRELNVKWTAEYPAMESVLFTSSAIPPGVGFMQPLASTQLLAGPQCSCRPGYDLAPDGRSCADIDECELFAQYWHQHDGTRTILALLPTTFKA
uniref:Ig-like domain-containing protein n=1 Tax=Globodera pallida TaxID=36090 RepID=A0A183BMA0_GLOPA